VFSTRTSTSGVHYQVDAEVPNPTPADLAARSRPVPAEMLLDTQLPDHLDGRLRHLVRTVTAGARNPYEQVYAIQEYLRGKSFTYDLNGAPTTNDGALAQFLFTTRRGYCEQFASAMTVLVRMLGLPARVAIGFNQGARQPDGSWLITNLDAHAWPEVWFPSAGWVPFEPTRRADGGTRTPAYAPSTDEATPTPEPIPSGGEQQVPVAVDPVPVPAPPAGSQPGPGDPPSPTPAARSKSGHAGLAWLAWSLLVVAVLAGVSAPGVARVVLRRRRLAPTTAAGGPSGRAVARVHAAWAELVDVAADLGIRLQPSDSPRTGAARLSAYLDAGPEIDDQDVAAARAALARLARAEERARYAPPGMSAPDPSDDVLTDIATASRMLWSVAPRGRRAVAAIAPPSVLHRVARSGVRQIAGQVRTGPAAERKRSARERREEADTAAR
jgi:hypothetical protein